MKHFTLAFASALLFLLAQPVFAYRFICNGIDADGNQESDHCGSCTDVSGPRWTAGSIAVKIDPNVRPKGLDQKAWVDLVKTSMDAWNNVPGARLNLYHSGDAKRRGFGTNPRDHEVFWIADRTEWRRKVGGGERGALGVTLTPYNCPTRAVKARQIVDADLVLNAVTNFGWREKCKTPNNCQSIRSTLTHELGHFVGLGHPCILCSWSIMSAQAGFDLDYPVFDDEQALRALYPGQSTGAMGLPCKSDSQCAVDLRCVEQEGAQYCSNSCTSDTDCSLGTVCDKANCKFISGSLAGAASVGESCINRVCDDGLLCAGTGGNNFYCFKACAKTTKCGSGEKCMPLEEGGGICMRIAAIGQSCDGKVPCDNKARCVEGACITQGQAENPDPGSTQEGGLVSNGGAYPAGIPFSVSGCNATAGVPTDATPLALALIAWIVLRIGRRGEKSMVRSPHVAGD